MEVGKYTYDLSHINVKNWGHNTKLKIGSFCSISTNLTVFLGGNHRIDRLSTYPFGHIHNDIFNKFNGEGHPKTNGDVIIGNDVWIGTDVTILSGVKIGDGSVIGTHSVVVKDVEPYTIVGGNPAKFIKKRFNDDVIERLLELKWWDWDDEKINRNLHILCSDNANDLLNIR